MMLSPVQIHTIEQVLAQLGAVNSHQGLHVISTVWNQAEFSILYPFRSDHFSFLIITEGEFKVKLNVIEYTARQGNVLMLQPHVVRQFIKVPPGCSVTSIMFTSEYLLGSSIQNKNVDAFEFLSSMVNPLLNTNNNEMAILLDLLNLLNLKLDQPNGQAYQEDVLLHIFTGFIYEISSLYKKQESIKEVRGTRQEDLTFRFLRLLPKHFKVYRSVHSYAAMLNISPKYLSKTVKEVSGKTAGDFIHEMVILEAKILLDNLELTIAQIAEELHFSDQFFFSKYFKMQSGKSPSQYRKTS
ncbi:helix-turn-helix domain-containing protein [Mucilaginibacter lappiensis]|uniref:helix-turn-helix domain-containing protein n=1 Tax=Mucilaginibacter lappiensis TaxID=354630 RepID=UPI003D19A33C